MFVGVGYSAQVDFLTRLVVIEHRVVTSDRTAPALSWVARSQLLSRNEHERRSSNENSKWCHSLLFIESNGNDKSDEQESPDQWVASGNWAPSRTFSRQPVSHRGRSLLPLTEEEYMEALDKEEKGDGLRKRPNHLPWQRRVRRQFVARVCPPSLVSSRYHVILRRRGCLAGNLWKMLLVISEGKEQRLIL